MNVHNIENCCFEEEHSSKEKIKSLEANDLQQTIIIRDTNHTDFTIDYNDEGKDLSEHQDELFGLDEHSTNRQKLIVLTRQAVPVVISFFLGVGGTFINLVFAGQFVHESGDKSTVFAGVSLANMFANVSCLSVLIGMSSAVETLGSQHNGAGNYKEVGIVLQRSYLILGLMTLPILVLWLYAADLFQLLGVEKDVCAVIRTFIRIRALTIPVDVVNESYEKYLMSIGVMQPSMWANIAFNALILLFNLLFVQGLGLDYSCLAWSWVLSVHISGAVQIALSWNHPAVQRTLQPWDRRAWDGWYDYVVLGLPGTVMLCSEWWAFEILTIFASLLGTTQVAAQTIIMQTASLAFMVPLGIGVASASLVGNALGAGQKALAIDIGKLSLAAIGVLEVGIGLVMLLGGPLFVDCFTSDHRVKDVATRAIPFLCLFATIDGVQGVASGVLRGAGKQFIGAVGNVIAFYAIGLPMAWVLCFRAGYGVNGLMMGIAFGTVFQVAVLLVLILRCEAYIYSSNIAATAAVLPSVVPGMRPDSATRRPERGSPWSRTGFSALAGDDTDEAEEGGKSVAMVQLPGFGDRAREADANDDYVRL